MRHDFGLPGGRLPPRRPRRSALFLIACAALGATAVIGMYRDPAPAGAHLAKADIELGAMIAPEPVGQPSGGFQRDVAPQPSWQPAPPPPVVVPAVVMPAAFPVQPEPPQEEQQAPFSLTLPPVREAAVPEFVHPLPLPRPSDLAAPRSPSPRLVTPGPSRRARTAEAAPAGEDSRSFFEKLFGVGQSQSGPSTALAYAAPQDELIDRNRPFRLSPSAPPSEISAARTAVYDITARTLYMPNGERLEAHSGFGDKMDDPRFVNVRMHGATPPHTYELTEREALFHGHRAVRMHPVGGSGAIFGRAGLLLHPYLLGPRGDSNGCVSVKDYERFLQAFLRGEVKRLVVVAGGGSSRIAALNPARN